MNILILNWRDPKNPLSGGAEVMLLEHAAYWKKKGADVTWFASFFPGAKAKEKVDGITYIRKGSHYTVHFWAFIFFLQGKFGKQDVVIDCFHFLPFFTPLYIRNTKIIALIHEVAKEVWFKNLPWLFAVLGNELEPFFFYFYKKVPFITVSNSTKKDLEMLGMPEKNIRVIANGTHIPKILKFSREKNPVMLFLGRITKDKGIEHAIESFALVCKTNPNIKFWIVGSGDVKYIQNLPSNIKYFGYVSEQKKYELLQKAWILVHPSIREGWGLTVIEANSMGMPVVGYNVPGLRDSIQDKKTGLLVNPNPKALAQGIGQLLEDKKLYQILSENAKDWSRQFNWGKSTQQSWSLLNNL